MKNLLFIAGGLGLLVVVAFFIMARQSQSGSLLGLINGSLAPCGTKPNCVSSLAAEDTQHYVAPLGFTNGNADESWQRLVVEIKAAGGVIEENAPPYLAATFTSSVFGFVDDFECLINDADDLIHLRSSSRVGYSDLNANRKRVEKIRSAFAQ